MVAPSCRGCAPRGMPARSPMLLLLCVAVALVASASAYDCNSGILQMKAIPQEYDSCFAAPLNTNSIKAACTSALRVRVKNGIVKIVPLVQASYNYSDVFPGDSNNVLNCKDANASGLFYPGSTTSASVMLYDDYGGPLSNLTKTAADQISLIPAHTYGYRGPGPNCTYNFTVVQGCVFGIKAPSKPPSCPAGFYQKKGRFGIKYCAPCAAGTYYDKSTATCKPCAKGTYSSTFGSLQCTKCDAGTYTNVTGATQCEYCSDNSYTDGKSCNACPNGSYSSANYAQCYKCDAGKKCCTVGWGKDCPKCATTGGSAAKTYTSIFALETATPSSCFATGHALCAPKINITVDPTCTISIDNRDYSNNPDDNTYCSWSTTAAVRGAQFSISDLASFDYYSDNSTLLAGNFTAAASPYLTVSIPDTKCTFQYRALTAPAAALLGAAPKPSKATSCPAGKYLETSTDTKPGPCLLCPPGTYSPRVSSGRKCIRCPAGTYTNHYGSTKCKRCPANRASKPGSASCSLCDTNSYPTKKGCKICPKASDITYPGAGQCLGNAYGTVCCAAGNCAGQPVCKGPRKSSNAFADDADVYTATLQLVSKSTAQPACKNATFLSCLPANAKLQISSSSSGPSSLSVEAYRTKFTCGDYSNSYSGGYTGSKTAYVSSYEVDIEDSIAYGLIADSSKGTVTMYLSPYTDNSYVPQVPVKASGDCSATFKLVNGYAFDLTPPKGAKCDPADAVTTYNGRQFCSPCPAGQYKNSTGLCSDCPAGTFSDQAGAATCKPCRAGYSCSEGTSYESACGYGYYSSKPRQSDCLQCPKNTYGSSSYDIPTTKCNKCPKGTIAPVTATACGVPWDKKFPA